MPSDAVVDTAHRLRPLFAPVALIVNFSSVPAATSPPLRLGRSRVGPGLPAAARSMRPAPRWSTPAGTEWAVSRNTSVVAVVISADFTCAGDQSGWRSRSSAAAPATCGVAMLVPDCGPKPVNGAGKSPTLWPEETMSTPGRRCRA
jgi:hypothetical protein